MSNSSNDLKYNLFHNTRIKQQREVTLTKDLTKAIYEIKYDKDIWSITWRGMTFSIKPYLCSGMSFITSSDIFITLCMCVFNSDENFYENLDDYERKEYLGIFTDDENDVSDSIFYQFNSRIPCIVRYLIGLEDMTVIRKLMGFIVKEFMSIWHNCDCYIDFADNDICNTEAFSYFLSMLWVFQKSKKLQILLCKELKSLGINEILNKLCPETSLHYKYLTGEITSKELKTRYIKDGVIYKELFNLLDRGTRKYDKDLDYVHIKQTCGSLRTYYEFEDFVTEMFTQYMMSGIYHMDLKKSKMCNKQLLDYKDCNSELVRENRDLRSKAERVKQWKKISSH